MRERPLVYFALPIAAAMYLLVYFELRPGVHISMLFLSVSMALAGFMVNHEKVFHLCCAFIAAAAAICWFSFYNELIAEPARSYKGSTIEVTATVISDADIYDDRQRAELRVKGDTVFKTMCYFPLTEEPLLAGDEVRAHISLHLPGKTEGFDRSLYQAADGKYISASCTLNDDGEPYLFSVDRRNENNIRYYPVRIARYCKEAVRSLFPEREAGLLTALLIGDKSGLSDDDALSLRIAGLSHLTAVSGLHVGFLVGFCCLVFGRRCGSWVSVPLILLFALVAGCTPSVLRAAIMYLIALAAFIVRKEADTLNSLCMALLVLLIQNPYSIASLSLQLSFSSTLGLVLFTGKLQNRMLKPFKGCPKPVRSLLSALFGAVSCTLCATAFTSPIVLTSFGSVSVMSVLSNILTVGVTALCFIGGFLFCLFSKLFVPAAGITATVVRPFLSYVLKAAEKIADIPFGRVYADDVFGVMALCVFFTGMLLFAVKGKSVKWKLVLPSMCGLIVMLIGVGANYDNTHYTVSFLPCGSGEAVIVQDKGRIALIDCGGDGGYHNAAKTVKEWMRWHGIDSIDALLLTAVDKTHARDLKELLENIEVGSVSIPKGCKETKTNADLLKLTKEKGAETVDEKQKLEGFQIEGFPVADGKLGVLIGDRTLILHSPTQKQLAKYLEENECRAPEIVLSERNLEDEELLEAAVEKTGAETVIVQAGWSCPETVAGLPVESPYISGEITRVMSR